MRDDSRHELAIALIIPDEPLDAFDNLALDQMLLARPKEVKRTASTASEPQSKRQYQGSWPINLLIPRFPGDLTLKQSCQGIRTCGA